MSGVQLRLLWDRNIFIVLMNAASVADEAGCIRRTDVASECSVYSEHDNFVFRIDFHTITCF